MFFFWSGLTAGGNLSTLELSPMMGGMKDMSGQQSRFKWMMEGHSPAPSPPDTALHKNGRLTDGSQWDFFFFCISKSHTSDAAATPLLTRHSQCIRA